MADFIINVGNATFKWQNDQLICDDKQLKNDLIQRVKFHVPKEIIKPGGLDYAYPLIYPEYAYNAILDQYPNAKIVKELKKEPAPPDSVY